MIAKLEDGATVIGGATTRVLASANIAACLALESRASFICASILRARTRCAAMREHWTNVRAITGTL